MPKTKFGQWSVGLISFFFLLFLIFRLLVASGQQGGETFFSNLALAIPGLMMAISGIGALFTGIVGIIKSKERSLLVFSSTFLGFLILWFCLGEILYPH